MQCGGRIESSTRIAYIEVPDQGCGEIADLVARLEMVGRFTVRPRPPPEFGVVVPAVRSNQVCVTVLDAVVFTAGKDVIAAVDIELPGSVPDV